MALEVTDSNFDELVIQSDVPVIVDFGQYGVALAGW